MKDAKGHGSASHSDGINKLPPAISPVAVAKIAQRPDGVSVRPDGSEPTSGYMVSLPGHSLVVPADRMQGAGAHAIVSQYAKDHAGALASKGAHIGSWTDQSTKQTYLDVSHNFKSRSAAINAGRSRNQIAIWDLNKGREIKTGGSGK